MSSNPPPTNPGSAPAPGAPGLFPSLFLFDGIYGVFLTLADYYNWPEDQREGLYGTPLYPYSVIQAIGRAWSEISSRPYTHFNPTLRFVCRALFDALVKQHAQDRFEQAQAPVATPASTAHPANSPWVSAPPPTQPSVNQNPISVPPASNAPPEINESTTNDNHAPAPAVTYTTRAPLAYGCSCRACVQRGHLTIAFSSSTTQPNSTHEHFANTTSLPSENQNAHPAHNPATPNPPPPAMSGGDSPPPHAMLFTIDGVTFPVHRQYIHQPRVNAEFIGVRIYVDMQETEQGGSQ